MYTDPAGGNRRRQSKEYRATARTATGVRRHRLLLEWHRPWSPSPNYLPAFRRRIHRVLSAIAMLTVFI